MSVRWIVLQHELLPAAVRAAVVRDPQTGDWLLVAPSDISDPNLRYAIVRQLLAQIRHWEGHGVQVTEVCGELLRAMG
ncbi:hypothetical protein HY68_01230 [Streptomyces sp. AcH 505]|uniref:hypothetical protein n=1 Tax=Streptomyces sp. AcH 505 TaxID=352211 RepID=UPI00059201E7|nr:hypothetical protein HY68_01230 [Streptomyces sp. AcH 505]